MFYYRYLVWNRLNDHLSFFYNDACIANYYLLPRLDWNCLMGSDGFGINKGLVCGTQVCQPKFTAGSDKLSMMSGYIIGLNP